MTRLDRTLWPALLALAGVLVLFELTDLDLAVQDRLYDAAQRRWLVDARAPGPRLVFYDAPKVALFGLALGGLALLVGPARWRQAVGLAVPGARRDLGVVLLTLASVPALIGAGKATTNIFCPLEIRRYGGDVPYVKLCESYALDDRPARRGRCFPAGHASGGFAMLALAGLGRTRRGQLLGAGVGLGLGSAMGGYQMLKGAHYLSHTLVTALVAWVLFLLWRRVLGAKREAAMSAEER